MHGGPSTPDSSMSPSTVGVRGHFFSWVKHCTDGAWHDAAKNANKSKEPKTPKNIKKCQTFFSFCSFSKCQSTSRIFFSSALGFETNCSMSENTHRSLKFRLMNLSGVRNLHSKQLVDTKGFCFYSKKLPTTFVKHFCPQ